MCKNPLKRASTHKNLFKKGVIFMMLLPRRRDDMDLEEIVSICLIIFLEMKTSSQRENTV